MEPNHAPSFVYKRIVVIGVTGCGKSVLAEKLAQKLDLNFIERMPCIGNRVGLIPTWKNSAKKSKRTHVPPLGH